jgi:hypothetical protein
MSPDDHPPDHVIEFTVDGEGVSTTVKVLTANAILTLAGLDPATHYLVEIRGREQISFEAKGAEEIELHPHIAFVSVATGPTPVSNVSTSTGAEAFVSQLAATGLEVEHRSDFVTFEWVVPVGQRLGERVHIALQLPADLPATPPPGPHVKPRLGHPGGSVNPSPLGPDWEYWSRPFAGWPQSPRTGPAYLAHLRALFKQL